MAKRSYITAIRTKQSSAYKGVIRTPEAILGIEGTSRREVSRRSQSALRSWQPKKSFVSQDTVDAQAEKRMNPHGWSSSKNPICPSCFVQKALNGSCCND